MPDYPVRRLDVSGINDDFVVRAADGKRELEGLAKINVFVGPNNSGKSRFLRELARQSKFKFVPAHDLSGLKALRADVASELNHIIQEPILDVSGYKATFNGLPQFEYVTAGDDPFTPWSQFLKQLASTTNPSISSRSAAFPDTTRLASAFGHLGERSIGRFAELAAALPPRWNFERVYIPTLRGLRPFQNSGDFYQERTRADYFPKNPDVQIESGLPLYRQIRSLLLGSLEERLVVEAFQRWLGDVFFDGAPVALIPREIKDKSDDVLFVKIGKEEEHPVYGLGDGIQMIICIMFPLYRASLSQNFVLLFIEEPELYLHPGLQRTLCQAIGLFPNVQSFLATHSNHILDLTLDRRDMAVFSVSKELVETGGLQLKARSTVELLSTHGSPILNALGVRNSSVFLSNCTIWVEGITDRRYLRKFLRLYYLNKHGLSETDAAKLPYKEDLHYSFVEYGGANITHWSFLDDTPDPIVVDRLCSRLMLIADKDDAPAKDARHEKLKERLQDRFVVLPRREVENLLPEPVLRKVIASYEKEGVDIPTFEYAAYAEVGLGKFIDELLGSAKTRRGKYGADSGTLTDKITFCDTAVGLLTNWEELSPEAQSLATQIAKFIEVHNKP